MRSHARRLKRLMRGTCTLCGSRVLSPSDPSNDAACFRNTSSNMPQVFVPSSSSAAMAGLRCRVSFAPMHLFAHEPALCRAIPRLPSSALAGQLYHLDVIDAVLLPASHPCRQSTSAAGSTATARPPLERSAACTSRFRTGPLGDPRAPLESTIPPRKKENPKGTNPN